MSVGVIHFMSEMLRDNQVTVRVNHFKSKMQPCDGGSFTSYQNNMGHLDDNWGNSLHVRNAISHPATTMLSQISKA